MANCMELQMVFCSRLFSFIFFQNRFCSKKYNSRSIKKKSIHPETNEFYFVRIIDFRLPRVIRRSSLSIDSEPQKNTRQHEKNLLDLSECEHYTYCTWTVRPKYNLWYFYLRVKLFEQLCIVRIKREKHRKHDEFRAQRLFPLEVASKWFIW